MPRFLLTDWTVDYGQGPIPVTIPHAWRQEVDVRWEGPAIYRTTLDVPDKPCWLVFHGVSYAARVFVNEELAAEHHGIWDAFSVPLIAHRASRIAFRVEVTKNGGTSYPVRDVASGFLPFVFNTFGGIYKEVELVESDEDPMLAIWGVSQRESGVAPLPRRAFRVDEGGAGGGRSGSRPHPVRSEALPRDPGTSTPLPPPPLASLQGEGEPPSSPLSLTDSSSPHPTIPSSPDSPTHTLTASPPPCRVTVKGTKIFVDGKPFYLRAPLTWGWYPEFGHTNPDEETVRKEVRQMKSMGFNTVKFCLWVPHHRYFEILEAEGMFAWLELPLWDPTPDPEKQEAMFEELRRIVLEYRRHSNIIVWTCGCELSSNTSAEYRERLYKMVKELTGAALVKDNSGGSEMYGGDLREFGDFYDFHPYCDLPFYPLVLDSLLVGPRKKMPILLGEFNDYDVHRDLARLKRERPFWTSRDPYLNDQGVRWQQDLPGILDENPMAKNEDGRQEPSRIMSQIKAGFIRSRVFEHVRSLEDIAGYVITGWRDTPIASSGMVDDWGSPVFGSEATGWNCETALYPIPYRRPPWIDGGNRAGWIDPFNYFEGPISLQFGFAGPPLRTGRITWDLERRDPQTSRRICKRTGGQVELDRARLGSEPFLAAISLGDLGHGNYLLVLTWGSIKWVGHLSVFNRPGSSGSSRWGKADRTGLLNDCQLCGNEDVVSTELDRDLALRIESGCRAVLLLRDRCTKSAPFWRECSQIWCWPDENPSFPYRWWNLLPVSPDRVIDLDALQEAVGKLEDLEILIDRIDTRTYREDPILIRAKVGKGTLVATTLRPYGGLGIQPVGVMNNPAGAALLESLIKLAEER